MLLRVEFDVATQCRDCGDQVFFLACCFDAFGHPLPDQRGRRQMRSASGSLDGLVDSRLEAQENTVDVVAAWGSSSAAARSSSAYSATVGASSRLISASDLIVIACLLVTAYVQRGKW